MARGLRRALVCLALLASVASAQRPDDVPGQGLGLDQAGNAGGRGSVIPGQYIVVFKEGGEPVPVVTERVRGQRPDAIEILSQYEAALRGCAIRLRPTPDLPDQAAQTAFINTLQTNLADIAYIEQDQVATAVQVVQVDTKGVNRIHGSARDYDSKNAMEFTGANVGIAIIDSGVADHKDLRAWVTSVPTYVASNLAGPCAALPTSIRGSDTNDCNGHGTHCAGTAAGKTTGVAPGTKIYPVKVLGTDGSGSYSGVIGGVDWVTANWDKVDPKIGVASMSLGGPASDSMDTAVNNLAAKGVVVVVAAGNSAANLMNTSPARAARVIAVTAVDVTNPTGNWPSSDKIASFSNYAVTGQTDTKRVIAAPGVGIYSTWKDGDSSYNTISGTSMAAPHVAGMVARCFGFKYKCNGNEKVQPKGCVGLQTTSRITASPSPSPTGRKGTKSSTTTSSIYYGFMGFAPLTDDTKFPRPAC